MIQNSSTQRFTPGSTLRQKFGAAALVAIFSLLDISVLAATADTRAARSNTAVTKPASKQTLALDSAKSPVNVVIDSGAIRVAGTLTNLSGTWNRTDAGTLEIKGNLRDVVFEPVNGFDLSALAQTALPPQDVIFRSSAGTCTQNGSCVIQGNVQIAKQQYAVSIPATVKHLPNYSTISVNRREVIREWPSQIPLPVVPGQTHGEVQTTLLFR